MRWLSRKKSDAVQSKLYSLDDAIEAVWRVHDAFMLPAHSVIESLFVYGPPLTPSEQAEEDRRIHQHSDIEVERQTVVPDKFFEYVPEIAKLWPQNENLEHDFANWSRAIGLILKKRFETAPESTIDLLKNLLENPETAPVGVAAVATVSKDLRLKLWPEISNALKDFANWPPVFREDTQTFYHDLLPEELLRRN